MNLINGVSLFLILKIRANNSKKIAFDLGLSRPVVILMIVITTIMIQMGISLPLSGLIPMPEIFRKAFLEFSSNTGFFAFVTIVIAAPVLEEFIFRGVDA